MAVDIRVAEWLRNGGHDALHLREQGLQRLPDEEIFVKARREDRVLITFDLDFGEIAAFSGERRPSVILFRLRNTRTPHVIERLSAALSQTATDLEKGSVVIVEEARFRLRPLPVGREMQ
jgi:predicted nuclease of predicted toxin-antitoxin system